MSEDINSCRRGCSIGARLVAERLAELNDLLRRPGHDGYRKLAERFGLGAGAKNAMRSHAVGCVQGVSAEVPPNHAETVPVQAGTLPGPGRDAPVEEAGHPGRDGTGLPGVRARGSANEAKTRDERVDFILGQRLAGRWDGARDTRRLSRAWGLAVDTVGEYARTAADIHERMSDDLEAERRAHASRWLFNWRASVRAGKHREANDALAGYAQTMGLVDTRAQLNIAIAGHPTIALFLRVLLEEFAGDPDVIARMERAVQRFRAQVAGPQAVRALPPAA
jgi:hypothetical protein